MTPKRVLFFAPFGAFRVHHQLDAVVAHALRQRGAEVLVIGCDGIYEHCDVVAWHRATAKEACANCAASGNECFNPFSLPRVQLRSYLTDEDYAHAVSWADGLEPKDYPTAMYEGYPLGDWVVSSVLTFFWVSWSSLSRPDIPPVHKQYLINGVLTLRAFNRILEEFKPTNLCAFNGRFAPYRVAFELSRLKNIPAFTHERGFINESFTLYDNNNANEHGAVQRTHDAWKDVNLSATELVRVSDYLDEREHGKNLNFPAFVRYSTEYATVRHRLGIPASAKIIGVFTSSECEAGNQEEMNIISSQREIIDKLFEIFRNRSEYLVIRHHPLIVGNSINPADYDFLSASYAVLKNAPPNVRVIMPSEEITSYSLIANLDACLALFSTVATESLARGVPTATLTESRFSIIATNHFSYKNLGALENTIDNLFAYNERMGPSDLSKSYRFVHTYISKVSRLFNSFGIENNYGPKIRITPDTPLPPGADPELDIVCNHILLGSSLHPVPTTEDKNRKNDEEISFFTEKLNEIKRQKASLLQASREFEATHPYESVTLIHSRNRPELKSIRYPKCTFSKITRDNTTTAKCLRDAIKRSNDDYILIAGDSLAYDPATLLDATYRLLQDKKNEFGAVFYGGWILDETQTIIDEVFTTRISGLSENITPEALAIISDPLHLLGFYVFRRGELSKILDGALNLSDESFRDYLIDYLTSFSCIRTRCPFVQIITNPINEDDMSIPTDRFFTAHERTLVQNPIMETVNMKSPEELLNEAIKYLGEDNYQKSLDCTIEAKKARKAIPNLDYVRALCFTGLGRHGDARECLNEELRHFPSNHQAKAFLDQILAEGDNTQQSNPALQDPEFKSILARIRPFTMLPEIRLFHLFQLAKQVTQSPIAGNFVECGVAGGGSSGMLAHLIKEYSKSPRTMFSCDSFTGMPEPSENDTLGGQLADQTGWGTGTCAAPETSLLTLCDQLSVRHLVTPVKGYFKDSLPSMRKLMGDISFLHIDCDWYESTLDILNNLYDQLTPGAVIVVDDYGYWDGMKKAIDEFQTTRNVTFSIKLLEGSAWFQKPA